MRPWTGLRCIRPKAKLGTDPLFEEQRYSGDPEEKQGVLEKKGTNLLNPWQSRYFVAAGHYLNYYGNQKDFQRGQGLRGSFDLREMTVMYNEGVEFDLVQETSGGSNHVTRLRAADQGDAKAWVQVLNRLKQMFSSRGYDHHV